MSSDLHLPHQLTGANRTLTAQCHCKSVHYTITVPTSALPLPAHLCHCGICRHVYGAFACVHAPLPLGVKLSFVPPSSLESSLTAYVHSEESAISERFFCSTCGCHIGDRGRRPDPNTGERQWCVSTSIFTVHDEDIFQIRSHIFSDPATEPNLATWLPSVNSRSLHVWKGMPPQLLQQLEQSGLTLANIDNNNDDDDDDDDDDDEKKKKKKKKKKEEEEEEENRVIDEATGSPLLPGQCQCGGVRFAIAAPTEDEANDTARGARFVRRATDGTSDKPKWVACICLCRDCRLVTGTHAVPWTFVPRSRIRPSSLVPPSPSGGDGEWGGTLRTYRSSDKVTRAFCGVCGATAFYAFHGEERAAGDGDWVVDVSVGLLRDPRRTVAIDDWFAWRTGKLAGMETGKEYDKGFAEGLAEGFKNWGLKTHGEATTFNIP